MAMTPVIAIIGRPNVGKSTLFNRLIGERRAVTDEVAGTTRDPVYGEVEWNKHHFLLVDTAGLAKAADEFELKVQEQVGEVAGIADALVVVADASGTITDEDRQAAKLALKSKRPVILALNKVDAAGGVEEPFERLGIKNIVRISALHGRGTGDLLDEIARHVKKAPKPPDDDKLRLAILGRPNVGKSSMLNALLGKQQALVWSRAGTTRDVGQASVKFHGRPVELLDTAGLRRRGKIVPGVEKFSTLRTLAAAQAADICLVVVDATEPAVAGDQHIAGLAKEAGKGLILALNKWDLVKDQEKAGDILTRQITADFQFVWWAPLIFTSATTGQNITKVFELASQIDKVRRQEIPTRKLNQLLQELIAKKPPAGSRGKQPKLNYVTQTGTRPPTFTFFGTFPETIHFSYKRYLENGLREAYDFTGTPIRLEFRSKYKGEIK